MPDADVWLYLGKSTCGKTFLARHHMRACPRQIIYDPNEEVDHGRGAYLCDDPEHLIDLVSRPGAIRICWRGFSTMGPVEAFEWANRAAWAGENFALFWDEVERYTPKHTTLPEWGDKILNAGRHRGLRVFAATRRPARMNTDIRDAATRICAGFITGENSIKYIREQWGADAERLRGLGEYEFLDWREDTGKIERRKSPFS